MSNNPQQIKARLNTIRSTKKITQAMYLVSVSKLRKYRHQLDDIKAYVDRLENIVSQVLTSLKSLDQDHPFLRKDDGTGSKQLMVFSSDLGLAGGYLVNLMKTMRGLEMDRYDQIVWLGQRSFKTLKNTYPAMNQDVILSEGLDPNLIFDQMDQWIDRFLQQTSNGVDLVFTRFKNIITYQPAVQRLLPLPMEDTKFSTEIIFDPSPAVILDQLIPQYVKMSLLLAYYEAKTSEYASRQIAMNGANKNAEDLLEDLQLIYNKLRQTAITQEITEIVSSTMKG